MELRCPNCATTQAAEHSSQGPPLCGGCGKIIYMPRDFPAIVAATFPGQSAQAVPLLPLFHMERVRVPAELSDGGGSLSARSQPPPPPPESERIDPSSVSAALDDIPTASVEPVDEPVNMPIGGIQQVPAVVAAPDETMQMLSLTGGSFAAALTPASGAPPPPADAQQTLSEMSTLPPPPWDHAPPPGIKPAEEQWNVSGPPPLARPPPPPMPPRLKPVDDIAAMLGLPQLKEIAPEQQAPAGVSTVADEAAEEERKIAKGGKRTMLIAAAVALLAGIAIAIIVASEMLKRTEPPPLPPPVANDTQAASTPSEVKTDKPENKTVPAYNPAKRAEAIEHYNKGNKLYLQKKLPDALSEYKRALESDSTFGYAHRGLAVIYASQGKNEKAIEAYKTYLQLAPEAKDAKQVRQIISNAEK